MNMSLVRSAGQFGSCELFSLKNGDDNPGLSSSMFNSEDSVDMVYTNELCDTNSYDRRYLLNSPSGEVARSLNDEPEYLDCQSPGPADYDENKLRLKFQELEHVLLDDNTFIGDRNNNHDHSMDLGGDSPKVSSSSNSVPSTISSTMDTSFSTSETPKSLLFQCAASIQNGNYEAAAHMIDILRRRVSIQGEPSERIAAYMVEALAARVATSGRGLYKALKCKDAPSSDRLSAMQVLFEVCPCFRFGFMTANGAILESFENEATVHIIDFDINQGSQYYTLLQTLAKSPGPWPHLRLTGVDDPESVNRAVGGLIVIGKRLEQHAIDLGISFEFHAVAAETALVSHAMLNCRPGEALVVNFAFQLHHLPDESVSTVNLRDRLLRMIKDLKPKLVTLVEQDVNTNTTPFLTRFNEAYNYYYAVFESLDAVLAKNSQDRVNVEKQCLARDIINVVACEGTERIERYEVSGKWRARMSMAGFKPCPISRNVSDEIKKLIKMYSDRYIVIEEAGALRFGWEDKILIMSSAWK